MKCSLYGLVFLGVAACADYSSVDHFEAIQDRESLSIILDRAECFGLCPSYIVEIRANGNVEYCGELYVQTPGVQSKKVPVESVSALFNKIISSNFLEFDDQYAFYATDGPTYQLQITFDGKTKRVIDYLGNEVGMPQVIVDLQDAVDDVAETAEWVGTPEIWEHGGEPLRSECENRFFNPFY